LGLVIRCHSTGCALRKVNNGGRARVREPVHSQLRLGLLQIEQAGISLPLTWSLALTRIPSPVGHGSGSNLNLNVIKHSHTQPNIVPCATSSGNRQTPESATARVTCHPSFFSLRPDYCILFVYRVYSIPLIPFNLRPDPCPIYPSKSRSG
jgi:hypothetical protein